MTPERRAELRADHETIWLEPACCGENADTGRTWCQHNVYACEDAVPATRYVRADIADARERRLREALEIALDMIHKLNGTFVPGNDAAGTEAADTCREIAAVLRKHAALSEVAPDA